ncbi:glutamate-rich protein 5-like [Callorhinchus milii]|uniref:glutamate-rich protein 5-like n=1 Tax=Callorhinchus milii TaxID=7868 RepID=UPI001C3F7A88|nr:glutamate-rich protein 5-like [Callorhinchus milii]
MGCSTSSQTQVQDANKPSPKSEESNGAHNCAAPDINGPVGENESMPDQSVLLLNPKQSVLIPGEVVTNEPSPSEDSQGVTKDSVTSLPAGVIPVEPVTPVASLEEDASPGTEDIIEIQTSESEQFTEGETGEKVESETTVEAVAEQPETKDEETEDPVAFAVTEIESKED